MADVPFVGPSYNLTSRPASVQRTVNLIPVPQEPSNERTSWIFKDVPGLVLVQEFQAAETVLFLFHMTSEVSSEGISEFPGGNDKFDQTGAVWETGGSGFSAISGFPYPVFGAKLLATDDPDRLSRSFDQTSTGQPDSYPIGDSSSLQIDAWVYIQASDVLDGDFIDISVGNFSYPLSASFDLSINDDFEISAGFENADVFTKAQGPDPIPTDQWVHIRLVYTGALLGVFVNGVLAAQSSMSGLLSLIDPINAMSIEIGSTGMYLDDVRGSIGAGASLDNFTPPTAAWPNP